MRLLRRIFLQHTGLKISALVIATALWVAYNSEPIVETAYSAPLMLVNVPSGLRVTGEVPSTVSLRLRGRSGRLRRVDPNELSVRADCSQAHAGNLSLAISPNMISAPYGADVVDVAPHQIDISLVSSSASSPSQN